MTASSIVLNLSWIVFGWQVIGAGSAFRPVPGQRGLSFLAQLISLSFFGLLYHPNPELLTVWGTAVGCAGLLASPNRATWTRNGQAIVAGPDAGATGPYLRVVVGLGGR